MSTWSKCELGTFITLKRGYDLPQQKRVEGPIPIFSSSGISGFHNISMANAPGVITGRYGTIGQVFYSKDNYWPLNTTLYVEDFHGNDPLFVYYFLKTIQWEKYLSSSAVPGINRNSVHTEIIRIPDKESQKRIASILRALDDKIELNTRINENLAEQAQSVLCSYMDNYDFDYRPLSDIADVIDCLHSKKPSAINGSVYQLIQLDNIRDDGFLDMSITKYMISQADYENWTRKCEITEGDCVITNVGRIGAISQAPYGTRAAMGRNMTCIRLKPGIKLYAYFITVLLSNHMRRQIQSNTDEGTIMGALNVKNIPKLLFPIFESSIINQLESVLYPLRKQIEYNNLQNQNLSQIRDILLPKLMSGEIDVSEIDL